MFKVQQPKPNGRIPKRFFVAYGTGKRSSEIVGILWKNMGGGVFRPVATGERLIKSKKVWAMRFEGYPNNGSFELSFYDPNTGNNLGNPIPLTVQSGVFAGPSIQYPENNQEVPLTFLTYGETDNANAHQADVFSDANMNTSVNPTVTLLFGPPDNEGYWCFEITTDALDPAYLKISANGATPDSRNIKIADI